jgi:hypothetical protein
VAKWEQLLNVGRGQTGVCCIISHLFCMSDIFKDKNWDGVWRDDREKGRADIAHWEASSA